MDCSIEGCSSVDAKPLGSRDEYALCGTHRGAWGYFHSGYLVALGKNDGRLRKKLWDKAMQEFLEHCRIEIAALTQIAEAIARNNSEASRESKYDGWLATMKIPAEVSVLELSVLASRLGIDMDAVRNKHMDGLYGDLLARVKEKGITQEVAE